MFSLNLETVYHLGSKIDKKPERIENPDVDFPAKQVVLLSPNGFMG